MNKQFQSFKKRATQLAITVALVGATAVGANAAHLGQTTGRVNFRKDATTKSTVIEKIAKGTDVTITGEKGNYFKIKYDGQSGYVAKKYVNENKYSVKSLAGTVTAKDGVNLRKGPGTDYDLAGRLNAGEKLEVVGQASNGWYKVKLADGTTAFVTNLDKYIQYDENIDVKPYDGKVKAKEDLNVRKGPGTSYDVVGRLKEGDVVEPLGQAANGWYQVKLADGTVGYITGSSKYVEKVTEPEQKDTTAPVITVKDTFEVTVGAEFKNEDLGATANDETDGDLTSAIEFSGDVDTTKAGEYTVKLSVKDKAGNEGTAQVKVTVKEKDTNAPVIAVGVDTPYQVTQNREFKPEDLKASAFDKEDEKNVEITYTYKDSTGKAIDKIDTSKIGQYTVILTAKDKAGNIATKDVIVNVVKSGAPVIDCKYSGLIFYVLKDSTFKPDKLGATAYDKEDGDLTSKIEYTYYKGDSLEDVKDANKVDKIDTSTEDTYYMVEMKVKDNDGNEVKNYVEVKISVSLGVNITNDDNDWDETIYAGEKLDTSDEGLKKFFGVKAEDGNGNDITKDVKVLVDKTIDTTKASGEAYKEDIGEYKQDIYNITFQVSNGGEAVVKKAILKVADLGFDIEFGNKDVQGPTPNDENLSDADYLAAIMVNDYQAFSSEQLKAHATFTTEKGNKSNCTVKYGQVIGDTSVSGAIGRVTVTVTNENGVSRTVCVYIVPIKQSNTAPVVSLGKDTKVVNNVLEVPFDDSDGTQNKGQGIPALLSLINAEVTDKEDFKDVTNNKVLATSLYGKSDYDLTVTLKNSNGETVKYVNDKDLNAEYTLTIQYKDKGANLPLLQGQEKTSNELKITIKVVKK